MVAMRNSSGMALAVGRFAGWEPLGFEAGDENWYRFVANGPTEGTDPSGLYVDLAIEVVSIGTGAWSFCTNVWAGQFGAAALDAGGIVLDVGLAVVPGVPGGTGLAVKVGREAAERTARGAADRVARLAAEKAARAAREAAEKAAKGGGKCAAANGPRIHKVQAVEGAGPHTGFKRDPQTGRVTGYTEFDAAGNPVKRFRGEGGPHGGQEPPCVLEPKPGKGPGTPPKVPRPPRLDELPPGYR